MKAIRRQCNAYAVLFLLGVFLTAWFVVQQMLEYALIWGGVSIVLLILLIRQGCLLYDANLILDNRIFAVPSAIITRSGEREGRETEETIVSTFGIMIGSMILKWGCDGVRGIRLSAIVIDQARIYLTFGDAAETMQVELLHGMTDKQVVMEVKQRLWRETGVTAVINGC